jgi:hypothetical protein
MHSRTIRALCLGLTTSLFVCASARAERITDRTHGFSIEKPADWCVLPSEAITQDHRTIEAANPELRKAIRDGSSMPVFALTRYVGAAHGLTSTVKIGLVPSAPLEGQTGPQILEVMLRSVQSLLADVNVETAPEVVSLAGTSAGHMRLTYTLKTKAGPERIASEMWAIPRGKYYLQVGATYPSDDQSGDRAAVIGLVGSLQLTN